MASVTKSCGAGRRAHTDQEATARYLDEVLDRQLVSLTISRSRNCSRRAYEKFRKMGQFFDLGG